MNNINISAIPEDRLFSTCDQDDYFLQFLIGNDNECADILRDLIGMFQVNQKLSSCQQKYDGTYYTVLFVGLDDVVPLLVAVDIPNRRFASMDYGVEITPDSVNDFVKKFQLNDLKFRVISEEGVENSEHL